MPKSQNKARAEEIINLHNQLEEVIRQSLPMAIRIGELLTEQKDSESMEHGKWRKWINDNLPFSRQTADNYMMVFRGRDKLKRLSVSHLTEAYRVLRGGEEQEDDEQGTTGKQERRRKKKDRGKGESGSPTNEREEKFTFSTAEVMKETDELIALLMQRLGAENDGDIILNALKSYKEQLDAKDKNKSKAKRSVA